MRQSKYTWELLVPLVKECTSLSQLIQKLGLKVSGGGQKYIKQRLQILNIDFDHFKGQSWAKGIKKPVGQHPRRSNNEVFRKNTEYRSHVIRKRLVEVGVPYKCAIEKCGIDTWLGGSLTLHVDHINGDQTDNRKSNLRFICPNCHQQTENWGYKGQTK